MVGIREDLANVIYNVDKNITPFLSNAPKTTAKNTYHEWQTDSYAAVADNKAVEGADATFSAASASTRVGNYTQIATKQIAVSGTHSKSNLAGRDKEMNYQIMKSGIEIKRDMENALVGLNNAQVAGNATTARELGSILSFIATNDDLGATGASPTGDGTDARTDGTQEAFTEARLEAVVDLIFAETGAAADCIMMGSWTKRLMNAFLGHATSTDHQATAGSILNAVDLYKSDYGMMKTFPNTFSRGRDVILYKKDMWAVAFYRQMQVNNIATIGDADRKQIVVEYTLEARNEASSGLVADCSTS
jgi:hypothetical protein